MGWILQNEEAENVRKGFTVIAKSMCQAKKKKMCEMAVCSVKGEIFNVIGTQSEVKWQKLKLRK